MQQWRIPVSHTHKTYVIFDGQSDLPAYASMKTWKADDDTAFDFYDGHDLRPLADRAAEDSVKGQLRLRMSTARQAIVLVGHTTKQLAKFVAWQIELAKTAGLPIVAVNLNNARNFDVGRCPESLWKAAAVHVSFNMKIVRYALDNFPALFTSLTPLTRNDRYFYSDDIYRELGLL